MTPNSTMTPRHLLLSFTKMHGLGNDFVVIDHLGESLQDSTDHPTRVITITPQNAQQICDRRMGVGADQILWLKKPHGAALDARMEILNADGSIAEMCGNGIRAVALYLHRHGPEKKEEYRIETLAGVKTVQIRGHEVAVDMGNPTLLSGFPREGEMFSWNGHDYRFFEVNVGNPHAVFFVDSVSAFPVEEMGAFVEKHSRFPQRTNVEFVEVQDSTSIKVRVWERGAGATLACGTGACAAAVASLATGRTAGPLDVYLPGGRLKISWKGIESGVPSPVMMEGPAEEVFQGTYTL